MKKCSLCQVSRPLTEYNKHAGRKDGLQTVCRSCNRDRASRYYADNTEKHKKICRARTKATLARNQQYVIDWLLTHACVDCGESDLLVLEFDHLYDKDTEISLAMQNGWGLDRLQQEIDKCEVVCANCHKRRTVQRAPNYRSRYLGSVTKVGIGEAF